MNSTERMLAALALQPTDRIPNAPFYEAPICNYFGPTFGAALLEGPAMADAHVKAVEQYQFDWVIVGMGLIGGIIPEMLGATVTYPSDVLPVIEQTPIKTHADVAGLGRTDIYTRRMERFLEGVALIKQKLGGEVPIAGEFVSPFSIATRIRGTNEIMEDLYENPDLVFDIQEELVGIDIQIGRAMIEAGMDYVFYGADMECPVLISADHYREFVAQPTTRVVNEFANLGAKVFPHMCGQIVKTGIVDQLLEMEIKGIMPGNLTQDDVLPLNELKDHVGDRICIFDNLNPNGPLLIGNPEEVRAETLRHLQNAKSMPGYVFSTSGTLALNTPRENFEAMNDTVLHFTTDTHL